jgi:SAM-dependent methyltransferase
MDKLSHPAKYTNQLLPIFAELLAGSRRILDPFAGTAKLRQIPTSARIVCLELEPRWALGFGSDLCGDALSLPFAAESFDAVCTSPTYGNRLADNFEPKDNSKRNSYRFALGSPLKEQNSGCLQWGSRYQAFHVRAWREVYRVLQPGGFLILNISDHIRAGQRVPVCAWHEQTLCSLGFTPIAFVEVPTPRLRYGANHRARVESELVIKFIKSKQGVYYD